MPLRHEKTKPQTTMVISIVVLRFAHVSITLINIPAIFPGLHSFLSLTVKTIDL